MYDDEEEFDDSLDEEETPSEGGEQNGGGASRRSLNSAKDAARGMQNPKDAKKIQDAVGKHRGQDQSKANAAGRKKAEEEGKDGQDGQKNENGSEEFKQAAKEEAKKVVVPVAEKIGNAYGPVAGKAAGKLAEKVIDESSAVDKGLEKAQEKLKKFQDNKKKIRIYKIVSAVAPIIMPYVIGIGVIVLIYSQIAAIMDQVQKALEAAAIGIEKYSNLISGDGWNTDEELFFKNLRSLEQDFGEDYVDIPLIAATIHYNKIVDISAFDGEEGENDDIVDDEDYDESDMSFLGGLVDIKQTHMFYQVANTKLGMSGYQIGGNGLVSNLVYEDIHFEKRDVTIGEAAALWLEFFEKQDDYRTKSYDELKELNDGSGFKTVVEILYSHSPFRIFGDLVKYYDTVYSFKELDQSYYDWETKNLLFDIGEQWSRTTGNYEDEDLENNPASIYSTLQGTGSVTNDEDDTMCSSTFECLKKVFGGYSEEDLETEKKDDKVEGGYWVPIFKLRMDYKKYYRYLVRVYIPATYFYKQELGVDYSFSDVIQMANEIFEQKNSFEYLSGVNQSDNTEGNKTFLEGNVTLDDYDESFVSQVTVSVMPVDGSSSPEAVVSLEDYTLGVVAKQLMTGVNDSDEYLKATIVAVKSSTLAKFAREGNYSIHMTNSNADFLYCNINSSCGLDQEKIDKLRSLYQEMSHYYIYNTEENFYSGFVREYKSNCSRENLLGKCVAYQEAKNLAANNKGWKSILAEFIDEPNGLLNASTKKVGYSTTMYFSSGLELGSDGYAVRTKAPTPEDIYWSPPWQGTGNIGQCVWYAKGRMLEIVANSLASDEKKQEALNHIKGSYGNGGDWFTNGMCNKFACSNDYTQPRTGSVAVYKWTDKYWSNSGYNTNYGHVIIVERVEGNKVWISEGWNKGGGAGGASSWSNVYVQYIERDISYMAHLSGYVNFVGYVYLLD